jgi:hypothetical protein
MAAEPVNEQPQRPAGADPSVPVPVAPGLLMEKELSAEPDGRYLLYYRFRRLEGAADDDHRDARP